MSYSVYDGVSCKLKAILSNEVFLDWDRTKHFKVIEIDCGAAWEYQGESFSYGNADRGMQLCILRGDVVKRN